ncbi:putative RNA-directed DNA polymerase, partial [Tanacetum coccineum]
MSSETGVNRPAPNPSTNSNFTLLSVLGRERLTDPNYMDWMRNLRFTLRYENKEYVLDEQIPTINDDSTQEEIEAHQKHYNDANKVSCIMASSMSPELRKTFENTWAYEMNQQLKEMFQAKASKERLDVVKSLTDCKPKPGASICAFVLEMKGYFDRLESLNMVFDTELSINIILSGLPADYNQFVLSYQTNEKETSIMKLHSLLQTAEQGIKKCDVPSTSAAPVLTIAPTSDPKEAMCFYCNTKGHWKRSCPKYLKDLKDGMVEKGVHSGMYMIKLHNTTTSDSWVLDTWCGTHICAVLQGLKESRRLKHGELNLIMGNRKITPVTMIGKFELMLKSGDGYQFSFDNENGDISVYLNGCFMFKASPFKGIYETVECISNDGNMILNVGSSNELDKSKLWHSRLGHINKKRIAQIQKDGVLESFNFKSDDLTPPRTPQLNGVVERRNRTLLDMVRSIMCRATLPISFWGYALETAAHILNLVPTKKLSKTRFEMWKGKRPSLGHIKIWGCEDNVMFVARRGVFLEREMISKEDSGSKIDLKEIQESADEEPIINTDTQQEVVTPVKPDDISLPIIRTKDKISDSILTELNKPANYKEAMASPEAAKWKEAMKSEIHSMLVAKGYTQTHRIDYEETFSPVAKIKSIRIMLAIAAFYDYKIWQMDVNTAFLNEKLTEDVFMAQPEDFENEKYPKRVCKLQKAIYRLKQASRSWNLCFHEKVTQFGFSRSEDESYVYVKVSGSVVVFLVLYVDDILLIGNDIPMLQSVKDWLGRCFAIKDLGDAAHILGIKIYRDRTKRLIRLSQDTYFDKILKRFRIKNSKKGNLPLHHGIDDEQRFLDTYFDKILKRFRIKNSKKGNLPLHHGIDDELDKMIRVPYASAIGSIMFLVYGEEKELRVTGYCDAGWQTDKDDSRSQSGWVFLLNGGAMTWKSLKQDTVADSTCESEYIAACEDSKEAIWMKNFIGDLGIVPTVQDPIEIFCDNESAVALTKEPKDHEKDKPADPFTKALAKSKHDEHAKSIGLKAKIEF